MNVENAEEDAEPGPWAESGFYLLDGGNFAVRGGNDQSAGGRDLTLRITEEPQKKCGQQQAHDRKNQHVAEQVEQGSNGKQGQRVIDSVSDHRQTH